jgi:hypothetical protein
MAKALNESMVDVDVDRNAYRLINNECRMSDLKRVWLLESKEWMEIEFIKRSPESRCHPYAS